MSYKSLFVYSNFEKKAVNIETALLIFICFMIDLVFSGYF